MMQSEHVVRMWEIRNTYKIVVGTPEEKRPLRAPGRKMDLHEMECDRVDWIKLGEERNQR
jgi:hypothetical protein